MAVNKPITFLSLLTVALYATGSAADQPTPLPHEAYVWQRVWTPAVSDAVKKHGANFTEIVVLKTEVAWEGGAPRLRDARIDYATLRGAKVPIGFALRIGAYTGPFSTNDIVARLLQQAASDIVTAARSNSISPVELQLDFDCAESKLEGYRVWVETISRKVAPMPVRITALPTWLNQASFKPLAAAAGAYILQVHSLQRPKDARSIGKLCDPSAAKSAVVKASKLGIPFRVALPTYSYLVAFGTNGHFIGLSAESPTKSWPEGTEVRELAADPLEMAGLVKDWQENRMPAMNGIIWFRFPCEQDVFNWRWPTLNAIMNSQSPREAVRVDLRRVDAGLVEIDLVNFGEIDISSRLAVEVHWQDARLMAVDALGGFEVFNQEPTAARFQSRNLPVQLRTGDKITIGWVRLDAEREVSGEVKKL